MRIFVFAYNRYTTMTTSNMLTEAGIDHYVVCHREEDVRRFREGGTLKVPDSRVIVTGNGRGLTRQRNSVLQLLEPDEWVMFMNDDLVRITMYAGYAGKADRIDITKDNISRIAEQMNRPIGVGDFVRQCERIIPKAERSGARLVGFVPHENVMFKGRRLTERGLVDGRCWILKNVPNLKFDENVNCLEDHEFTAYHLCRFGKVRVENWICPTFGRMTKGGFGTIDERTGELRREAKYLIEKYPFLFGYKDKKGYPKGTQLKFLRDEFLTAK